MHSACVRGSSPLCIYRDGSTGLLEEYPPVYEQVQAGGTMELARKANGRHARNLFLLFLLFLFFFAFFASKLSF